MKPFLSLCFLLVAHAVADDEVPVWVRQAATAQAPAYPPKATAVALLQEEHLTVDSEGRRLMRVRGVIRLLQRGAQVGASRSYDTRDGRIRLMHGWLLTPGEKDVVFGKDAILDLSLADGGVEYIEARRKVLRCPTGAPAGSIFAYEIEEEERTIFTQYSYSFYHGAPALISRFVLSLPPGGEARGTMINHSPMEPQVSGATHTWELHDLPYLEYEDHQPPFSSLTPRLALNYYPAASANPRLRRVDDWRSVSSWMSELTDPAATVTPAIERKAVELTRGASSDLDKVKAIAAFAQKVNYISVQLNVTRGGGYTPHPAESILAKNYGDCKDKSTLTRALLKAAGFDSYYTLIYWGDRSYVRPEWPSPSPFNHVIVSIRVPASISLPSVFEHPTLGRLLPFDPTASRTPLGDIPEDQQGSNALIVAGARGALVKIPQLDPKFNRVENTVEAGFVPARGLEVHFARRYYGQSATGWRGALRDDGEAEVKRRIETRLRTRIGGISLGAVKAADAFDQGRFDLDATFTAQHFGQLMRDRLFIFKPGLLAMGSHYAFTTSERKLPIELDAHHAHDRVVVKLPDGLQLDELPDNAAFETPYGTYRAQYASKPGEVSFEQWLEVKQVTAPASDYAKVKEFFERVHSGEQASVVLIKNR
ncbi:MAG: transglutaminase domain-containing protein [Bryobacteraceae bacterium]